MIELTLLTLLNYVGDNFCEYRNLGHDNYKSLLLAYSDASNKFGTLEVKNVIEKCCDIDRYESSDHFKFNDASGQSKGQCSSRGHG